MAAKKDKEVIEKAQQRLYSSVSKIISDFNKKAEIKVTDLRFDGIDFGYEQVKNHAFSPVPQIYNDVGEIPAGSDMVLEMVEPNLTFKVRDIIPIFKEIPNHKLLYQHLPAKPAGPKGSKAEPVAKGKPLAVVDANRIYIPFSLIDFPEKDAPEILGYILNWALPLVLHNINNYDYAKEKMQFRELHAKALKERASNLKQSIEKNENELSALTTKMAGLIGSIEADRKFLEAFASSAEDEINRRAEAEFTAIMRLAPGAYAKMEIGVNEIVGTTYPITIENLKKVYSMGSYRVKVNTDNNRVSVESSAPVQGHQHPHISSPTEICWGNISTSIGKLLGEREYAGFFSIVLSYLGSYNASDSRIKITEWPSAAQKGAKVETPMIKEITT